VAPSTASEHLAKLVRGRLVNFEAVGRRRYYRLAGPEVADALEALEFLSVTTTPMEQLIPGIDDSLRYARICYDHLAGRLAIDITNELVRAGAIDEKRDSFELTAAGGSRFELLGVNLAGTGPHPRKLARRCMDWTEKQPHLGGSLGAAVFKRFEQLKWIEVDRHSLRVSLTGAGRSGIRKNFGITPQA
jgi:hypothetical protein